MVSNDSSRPDEFLVNYCGFTLNMKCGENLCYDEKFYVNVGLPSYRGAISLCTRHVGHDFSPFNQSWLTIFVSNIYLV